MARIPQNLVDPFGRRIALAELEHRLQGQDLRYLSTLPPEFDPEQPSPEATHVVVELEMEGYVRDRCCWRIDLIDLNRLFYGRLPPSLR